MPTAQSTLLAYDKKRYRKRKRDQDKLNKQVLTRRQFLRKQILENDRIDLLMTEVLIIS
jgi:hypothetical protein